MTPKFKIIPRDGKASLWVNERNIWDLPPKELTATVEKAIMSAYFVGAEDVIREINQTCCVTGRFSTVFEKLEEVAE